jgi:hypothetical protein
MNQPNDHLTPAERWVFTELVEFFRPWNTWLNSLPPPVWHSAAVGLFVITAIVVAFIPRDYILRGAPDRNSWRDLRWWAAVALAPYAVIYYFLR